jgi:uncharacterized membrane protein YGL010W
MSMGRGAFGWKERMGIHQAYHLSAVNRLLHWICIPLELWSILVALSLIRVGSVDLALLAILAVAPIYLATERVIGSLMVLVLFAGWWLAHRAFDGSSASLALISSVLLFAVTFGVQVRVGHGIFEGGRDDTGKNLAELARTRNPIPLVLVFYYHLVELVLAAGYRPQLKREIDRFTLAELEG